MYAPRVPVTSILQAIAVLGLNRLRGVCLTVGIRAYLGKSLNRLSLRAIWRHSLGCKMLSTDREVIAFEVSSKINVVELA